MIITIQVPHLTRLTQTGSQQAQATAEWAPIINIMIIIMITIINIMITIINIMIIIIFVVTKSTLWPWSLIIIIFFSPFSASAPKLTKPRSLGKKLKKQQFAEFLGKRKSEANVQVLFFFTASRSSTSSSQYHQSVSNVAFFRSWKLCGAKIIYH